MTNRIPGDPVVTLDHLTVFGGIIHTFAMAETGLKIGLACLLEIDLIDLLILTEPYNSASLGNVIRSIAVARDPVTIASQELAALADGLRDAAGLRNSIAHDRWRLGTRIGAIRPSKLDIRGGRLRVRGLEDTDMDFTLPELRKAHDDLVDLNASIVRYLERYGCQERVSKASQAVRE